MRYLLFILLLTFIFTQDEFRGFKKFYDFKERQVNTGYGDNFVFTVKGDTFSCPIYDGGTYDFTVNWGDGHIGIVTSHDDADRYHKYGSSGTYEVRIDGTLYGWRFNNGGTKSQLYQILNWGNGTFRLGNGNGYFYGCNNLISITSDDVLDLTGTTDLASMFYGCTSLTSVGDLSLLDVGGVIDISAMFSGCSSLISLGDLSSWDTEDITSFSLTFNGCSSLTSVGAQDWNISSLTNAANMFNGVTLSTAEYSELLINWEAQEENADVTFHGGNSKYSAGGAVTAREALVDNGWTITDGGQYLPVDNVIVYLHGSYGVTESGSGVSKWYNQINNEIDYFYQNVDADRPAYISSSYIDFDKSNTEYLIASDTDSLTFGDGSSTDSPFSISAYVFIDDATSFRLFGKGDSGTPEYTLVTNPNDYLIFVMYDEDDSHYIYRLSDAKLTGNEGEWITLTGTYDGSSSTDGIILYIDDTSIASTPGSAAPYSAMHNTTDVATLGYTALGTLHADGKMQYVIITRDVITPTEVSNLHSFFSTGSWPE